MSNDFLCLLVFINDDMKIICQVQGTKYDVVLNDEDNNFMDAWLDSPSTDPRVRSGLSDYDLNSLTFKMSSTL